MTDTNTYDTTDGVDAYVTMAEGYDGRTHVERLGQLLRPGSQVLELGMGPGVDLDLLLARHYDVVGSDRSQAFLDRYARMRPEVELLRLDAVSIDTARTFDAIYSNKVLHQLTTEDLTRSLRRQAQLVRPEGVLLHGLWAGDGAGVYDGLLHREYTRETFAAVVPSTLELVEVTPYREMTTDDSIRVVLRSARDGD